VELDQGKLQETAHRLFLVDEEARQVLRKVLMFVGIKGSTPWSAARILF